MPTPAAVIAGPRPQPTATADTAPIEPAPLGEGAGASPQPQGSTGLGWWVSALAALGLLAGVAVVTWLLVRRRATLALPAAERIEDAGAEPPAPVDLRTRPPMPGAAAAPVAPSNGLTFDFRPARAGVNLLSATVTGDVVVANGGTEPVEHIQLEARLISAHAKQDEELRAIHAAPIGRPAAPAFALQPGEERRVGVVAALPHAAIRPMEAGGRSFFVPLVAITTTFRRGGEPGRAGRAFGVGIERVDSVKLAPIWLDGPPRSYEQVAARAHGEAFEG